jgi:hypothetical protein
MGEATTMRLPKVLLARFNRMFAEDYEKTGISLVQAQYLEKCLNRIEELNKMEETQNDEAHK